MSKHTPGPWRAEDASDGYVIESSSREMSATVAVIQARRSVTGAADARLIAAAPELLEVVKMAAEVGCHERAIDYLREQARAAIAKATG